MTTPPLKKSIGRSPLRLRFFLAALAVACFALMPFAQSAQAVGPEPNEDDFIGNMAEEDNAVPGLASDTEEAATGQRDKTPNQRMIKIKSPIQTAPCAFSEKVTLRGLCQLEVSFGFKKTVILGQVDRSFREKDAKLTGFSGTGQKTGRTYVASHAVIIPHTWANIDGRGNGDFTLVVRVTGKANPRGKSDPLPGKDVHFRLKYSIDWKSVNHEVTLFKPSGPEVECK